MSGATVAIGAGVAAAGAGVSAYANNQALRKQDSAAAAGINRQNLLRSQAQSDVAKVIKSRATDNAANLAANTKTQNDAYAAALQRANPVQGAAIASQPGASKRYAADVIAARGNVSKFGQDLAARTAAIDAPAITNLQTQLGLGDTATKLGLLSDTSANENNLTEMQIKAIQANPWLLAAGQTLQGAGEAYAGSGFAGKGVSKYGKIPAGGAGITADNGLTGAVAGLA